MTPMIWAYRCCNRIFSVSLHMLLMQRDYRKRTFGWKFSSLSFQTEEKINTETLFTRSLFVFLSVTVWPSTLYPSPLNRSMHTLLTRSVCRNFIDPSFNSLLINVPWPWSASLSHLFIKFIKNICGNSECASLARGRLWELQPDLTALKSHSFSINRQLIQKIGAHITVQCDFWSVRILYCFSHRCVFYGGKFRILSTFDSSKNDAIKSKKLIIMRCFTLNITICASLCVWVSSVTHRSASICSSNHLSSCLCQQLHEQTNEK